MKLCKKRRAAELRHEGAELLGQQCQKAAHSPHLREPVLSSRRTFLCRCHCAASRGNSSSSKCFKSPRPQVTEVCRLIYQDTS